MIMLESRDDTLRESRRTSNAAKLRAKAKNYERHAIACRLYL